MMAVNRDDLASVEYWRSEQRQPQRFYIAFCLLMSSIQDSFLGVKEERPENLNWSATCSYYALVHAGRLLVFLALGDYPTSHLKLRQLLGTGTPESRFRSSRQYGFPFDWLEQFIGEAGPSASPGRNATRATPSNSVECRDAIADDLTQIGVKSAPEHLNRFGSVLAAAAELRNDSNYEALLIAHEYRHDLMSDTFKDLAREMATANDSNLPFVEEVFRCFVQADQDLEADRAGYRTFVDVYLSSRLEEAINRKLGGCDDLKRKLRETISGVVPLGERSPYSDLEHRVSFGLFGGKAQLMTKFQNKIADLRRAAE